MAGFRIFIGADASKLQKTLGELQKDLLTFKKQLSTATDPQQVVRLNQAIAQTDRAIKSISGAQSINALNTSLKQLPAGANQAALGLTNLGRVVSDAPFGFIAISNNIEPLIQSFVYLRQQSGSTSAAMKALGSSLLGGGGLVLGVSLLTSAMTLFSQRAATGRGELEGFAKAQADANKEAGDQVAHLRVLAAVAANTSNAIKDRKIAAEELTKALKENNIQLTNEEALNNQAAKAINVATSAILQRAQARAIENRVAEKSTENLNRDLKREDFTKRLTKAQAEYNRQLAEEQKRLEGTGEVAFGNVELATEIEGLKQTIGELNAETKKANAEIDGLLKRATTAPTGGGGGDPVVDLLKRRIEALQKLRSEAGLTSNQQIELAQLEIQLIKRDSIKLGFTPQEIQDRIDAVIKSAFPGEQVTSRLKIRIVGELDSTAPTIDTSAINQPSDISTTLGLDKIDVTKVNAVVKALQDAAKAKNELLDLSKGEEFAVLFTEQLTPAFSDFFMSLQTDGSDAFKELGRDIARFVQKLLAAAAAAAALGGILSAITGVPFKASFRGLFSSISGINLPGFAEGGIATRATRGIFGEAGPEAVIPLSRIPQMIGQANFGSGGGEMTARIVDGGRDLILHMQRANKTFGRNF